MIDLLSTRSFVEILRKHVGSDEEVCEVKEEPIYGPVTLLKSRVNGEEVVSVSIKFSNYIKLYTCSLRNWDIVSKSFPHVEIRGKALFKYLPSDYVSKYVSDWRDRPPCEVLDTLRKIPVEEVEENVKIGEVPCRLTVDFKDSEIYVTIELNGSINGVVTTDLASLFGLAKAVGLFTTTEFIHMPIPKGLIIVRRPFIPLLPIVIIKCVNLSKSDEVYVGVEKTLLKWDCLYKVKFDVDKPFTTIFRTLRIPVLGAFTVITHGSTIIQGLQKLLIEVG